MNLKNKNIGIIFIDRIYIKEDLLKELNKISKFENTNITSFFKEENIITQNNLYLIERITKNKAVFYENDKLHHSTIKPFDILILVGFTTELLDKLNSRIFDNFVLQLINVHEKENIPIIIGLKANLDIFQVFEKIVLNYNKGKYYFIPILFPNPISKPKFISFDSSLIIKTTENALKKEQIEPIMSNNYI